MENNKIVQCKTDSSLELKNLFYFLNEMFSDTEIEFNKDGYIKIFMLNHHQSLFVDIKLDSKKFLEFTIEPQKFITQFSSNDELFKKFVRDINKNHIIEIFVDKNDFMHFKTNGDSVLYHSQQIYAPDQEPKKLPNFTNFDFTIEMDPHYFSEICKEISKISKFIEIRCSNKKIFFEAHGKDQSYMKTYNNDNKESETCIEFTECTSRYIKQYTEKNPNMKLTCLHDNEDSIVCCVYDVGHLVPLKYFNTTAHNCKLFLKSDYPLIISYNIGDLGKGTFGFSPIK